eukprot:Gb_36200 [translate_table: standard]
MRTQSAKAYANLPTKKVVKHARQEYAILHALELKQKEQSSCLEAIHLEENKSGSMVNQSQVNFEDYSDFLEPDSPLDALQSKQVKQASLSAMPRNNLDCTGISFEKETKLQAAQHIYESKDGHCHYVSIISDNACSTLSKHMDDKSFLHPDSHMEESTLTDFSPVHSSSSTKKFHREMVGRGSNFPIEGQVTLTSKEGLDETRFSRYLCQPDSVEQKHGNCNCSRSFLETSDTGTALMHGIAFEDKVHSSKELRAKKVTNNTYEESVSSEKGDELWFIFQCNAIKEQGIQAVMAIGGEWLLEVSKTANTSRDAFSALQLGLLSPVYLRLLFECMGATCIKLGQFISSTPTLFSADYVTKFQNCFDKAPAVPFQEIDAIIRDELTLPLEIAYEYIDQVPIALASITQAHGTRLKGSQKEVVFKILKPGIEDFFIADPNFLHEVARIVEFLNPQISCTSLIDLDSIRSLFCSLETSLITALNIWFGNLLSCETFHVDVHAGNLWLLHDGRIGFLDLGIVGHISPNSRLKIMLDDEDMPCKWYNLIGNLPEPPPPALNPETREPLKLKDFFPLFPKEMIMQEASQRRYIDIPEEVLEVYKRWRSKPLFKENKLEKMLGTPSRIYYKYEGVKSLCEVWQVRASYDQKTYRKMMIETWGAKVHPSPSDLTNAGHFILSKDPNSPGSLGIAISEAEEMALANADTKYSLGSVLNHVLLHQTIIGEEFIKRMAILGETPDIIVGCTGGGSNFAGLSFPFIRETLAGNINHTIRVVEPAACPLTKGVYVYDYAHITGMTPLLKMHSLGHDFIPDPIHARGLH